MDGPTWYEIHVQSYLDDSLAPVFAGMTIRHEALDETVLCGPLADQAALHGVLMRIRDLGLTLLVVRRIANDQHCNPPQPNKEQINE